MMHMTHNSVGSVELYYIISCRFTEDMLRKGNPIWCNDDWQTPVSFLIWRYPDGGQGILIGNLETGITGNSQFAVHGTLKIPTVKQEDSWLALGGHKPGLMEKTQDGYKIALAPHSFAVMYLPSSD